MGKTKIGVYIVGIGMEIIANVFPQKYPDISDWVYTLLFYVGIIMILFFPIKWLCGIFLKNWLVISSNRLLFAMIILIGIVVGSIGTYLCFNRSVGNVGNMASNEMYPQWKEKIKKPVIGKTFSKERVVLDGFSYSQCTFKNVTIVYKGIAPFDMVNPVFEGSTVFDFTSVPMMDTLVKILKGIGQLKNINIGQVNKKGEIVSLEISPEITKESSPYWKNEARKPVIGKSFMNERVELDGFSYNNCEFTNVTFVYKGVAPFDLVSCKIIGTRRIDTASNPAISSTIKLLNEFGCFNDNFKLNGIDTTKK